MASKSPASLYSLRIELLDIEPLIWRRVYVPVNIDLPTLHTTFQAVMGWNNSHLHRFTIGAKNYGVQDPDFPEESLQNERGVRLDKLLGGSIREFEYAYDFGDDWEHRVVVESTIKAKSGFPYPLCVAGERACPPEDVGGPPGYQDFLKVILNQNHRERDRMLLWAGGFFDPEGFDVNALNARLRS